MFGFYENGDQVLVISAPLYGGALLGQQGTIVAWDGTSPNPFPECLRVEFEDGFTCFLDKATVTPVRAYHWHFY
jgi:hypothetical protein